MTAKTKIDPWEAESDARTLMEIEVINSNPARKNRALTQVAKITQKKQKEVTAGKKLLRKKRGKK